jgi:hypothetical protein
MKKRAGETDGKIISLRVEIVKKVFRFNKKTIYKISNAKI